MTTTDIVRAALEKVLMPNAVAAALDALETGMYMPPGASPSSVPETGRVTHSEDPEVTVITYANGRYALFDTDAVIGRETCLRPPNGNGGLNAWAHPGSLPYFRGAGGGLAYRVVMGQAPHSGMTVDHLNRNTFDNRRNNLEVVTANENRRRQGKDRRPVGAAA